MLKTKTMNRRILNIIAIAALSVLTLDSCDKESEGVTRTTYYPTIELEGDAVMYVDKGSEYVEPGYISMLNGEDVTSGVTVVSDVDTDASGVYYVNYITIDNEDGFGAAATRKVVVLDFSDPIEGVYVVNSAVSFRDYGGTIANFKGDFEILIISNGDGTYYVSDLFGGWYDQGAGYGSNYACVAVMTINGATVDVDPDDTFVAGWGDSIDDFHDASYDKTTKTLTYQTDYAGIMTFNVTLVKQPIE
mgnify:CR=1 FL=1